MAYLARFVILETLAARGAFTPSTRLVTIAASGPTLPKFARLEFGNLAEVQARTGMVSHGQAQLANDLLTAQAAARYGVTAIGYGPGSVDTNIRREIPGLIRTIIKPFFARSTRTATQVGVQLADLFDDDTLTVGGTYFYDRNGSFPPADFITDSTRQRDLLQASLQLALPLLSNDQNK